jgi:hypothetical protein
MYHTVSKRFAHLLLLMPVRSGDFRNPPVAATAEYAHGHEYAYARDARWAIVVGRGCFAAQGRALPGRRQRSWCP